VTLNRGTLLSHVVRKVDPIAMPVVPAPAASPGTRDVTLNNASQSIGDFGTLRNLTLNSNAGLRAISAGAYGTFTANGGSGFLLGVVGATEPAVYHLQSLTLNSGAHVQVVGPVVIRLANGATLNGGGTAGSAANPAWLRLEVANGGVTLNSGTTVHGNVVAPNGTVTLNANTRIRGNVSADRLTIGGSGLLEEVAP
jgi:hypothetical protein